MQLDEAAVRAWIDRYVVAWNSNDPDDIAGLFTDSSIYVTGPFDEPWRGREEIVRRWLDRKDIPGDTTFQYEVVAISGSFAVVRGVTTYRTPPATYGNLWLVRFEDESRASAFEEWWMQK